MEIVCNICQKTVQFSQKLSPKQLKVLKFIKKYEDKKGKSPSFRDIAEGCGYTTPSAAYGIVERLTAKQFIEKRKYSARSIVLLRELPCG